MGGACCIPQNANRDDFDMRNSKRGDKRNSGKKGQKSEDNAFKDEPTVAEFKVERRDSIGMAAKQHTKKIMKESVQDSWASGNLRMTDPNVEVNDQSSQEGYDPLQQTEIKSAPLGIQETTNVQTDFKCDKSMGAMSFGEKAKPLDAVSRMSEVSFEPAERDKKYSQTEMVPSQR